jgi:hypothetical protein
MHVHEQKEKILKDKFCQISENLYDDISSIISKWS